MKIELKHGAGGAAMDKLLKEKIVKNIRNRKAEIPLQYMDDSSVIDGIVFTTDSYTIKPIFFPGGDIGKLSVSGTVNDLSVIGAEPIALSSAMVVQEGFEIDDIEKIVKSMEETAELAGVEIITGDFKVVERDDLHDIIINTSGIGKRSPLLDKNFQIVNRYKKHDENWLLDRNVKDGDVFIVSGYIGDHGISVLSVREGIYFETDVKSDVRPLNKMMEKILDVGGIVAAKDPTRGGLANALNEISEKSGVGILINESSIPIRDGVKSACDMLGIDPLEIGNEGKAVIVTVEEMAQDVLNALKETEEGKDAAIIGKATKNLEYVVMETKYGGKRVVEKPIGDPVPRIC